MSFPKFSPGPFPYYHGTGSTGAIDALVSGEPLRAHHPQGRERRSVTGAAKGFTYLTPDFRYAADFARQTQRDDWPNDHDVAFASHAHIFAFDLTDVSGVILEEDELGWAATQSINVVRGPRGVWENGRLVGARKGGAWSGNYAFSEAFLSDLALITDMASLAYEHLHQEKRLSWYFEGRDNLSHFGGKDFVFAGNRMRRHIGPDLGQRLINLGISVAIREEVMPVAAWRFENVNKVATPNSSDETEPVRIDRTSALCLG